MKNTTVSYDDHTAPVTRVHTLVIGSGAAGLNAAVQLRRRGISDILILTEGLKMGTSINTGSDKQTYYKMSLCGADGDSPQMMAQSYFQMGSMHGDLALAESALSTRAFFNLVDLGVRFPHDSLGQYVGYKTDHDSARRATSVGPYTSRDMCLALISEVQRLKIPVEEKLSVYKLLTVGSGDEKRACGALAVNNLGALSVYIAENVIFAVGGPGGIYKTSVYPAGHTGAIGVALEAGAKARGLPESQFGLASTKFRWNVSGSYMQVVPAFISTDADGQSDPCEFFSWYFSDLNEMSNRIFLKGYEWPFDVRKVKDGSSVIDLLVYIETVVKGRRVFLDFRKNPKGYDYNALDAVVKEYLDNSGALQETPFRRLQHMNPGAIALYKDHNIDLENELLEIAVCAQHNNGGLAGDIWWESENISHLFPVGEVNGSHGVARPGGAALNSGQVGGIRAADLIAARYSGSSLNVSEALSQAEKALGESRAYLAKCGSASSNWRDVFSEIQDRMSLAGAHIRSEKTLIQAVDDARSLMDKLKQDGCSMKGVGETEKVLSMYQLCFAHLVYLEAILYYVQSGTGSRGSGMIIEGSADVDRPECFAIIEENPEYRKMALETVFEEGKVRNCWVPCRPVPDDELWFETVWADYRAGKIFD